jgi:hypothetical protein
MPRRRSRPDGFNINANCGSTRPEAMLQEQVAAHRRPARHRARRRRRPRDHGRRDRCAVIDGDQLHGRLIGSDHVARSNGLLSGGGAVVATVMSNLGLERYPRRLRGRPEADPHARSATATSSSEMHRRRLQSSAASNPVTSS